jgi:chorismate mutase/prephenate dehydratase
MAKAKPSKSSEGKKKTPRPLTPANVQAKLNRLDRQLVAQLQERAKWSIRAARLAEAAPAQSSPAPAAPPPSPMALAAAGAATEDLFQRVCSLSTGPLPPACLRAIFGELLSGCRALVGVTKIALLGPLYSYSHLAAIQRFGQSVQFVPVGNIAAVFEEVNRGHSQYGLVPIENSTDGRIADTLDMFTRLPVRICGEIEMRIHHTLLGKCPRSEVKEVYSKPQALSQCRNWLTKHLPGARTIEVTSTTTAAQLAKEKPGAAAIASLQAGIFYGLDIVAERIEDNPTNSTRFAIIGSHSAPRTGHDKTAILFQVEHRPGALAEAMNVFKRNHLNLTWIESFPIPDLVHAYLFFIEVEGHETDSRVRRAVAALERRALRLEVLGCFPITPIAD